MSSIWILYPAIAMFLLTFSMIALMGVRRYRATARREVSMKFYRLYQDGEEPDHLRLLTRHVQNHFEVPPLFYVAVLMLYVTANVSVVSLTAAWLFVGFRALHSYVHLHGNDVRRRFFLFGASLLMLLTLWLFLLQALLRA